MKKFIITEEVLTDLELRVGSYYGFEDIRNRPLKAELKKERNKVLDEFVKYINGLNWYPTSVPIPAGYVFRWIEDLRGGQ